MKLHSNIWHECNTDIDPNRSFAFFSTSVLFKLLKYFIKNYFLLIKYVHFGL